MFNIVVSETDISAVKSLSYKDREQESSPIIDILTFPLQVTAWKNSQNFMTSEEVAERLSVSLIVELTSIFLNVTIPADKKNEPTKRFKKIYPYT